MSAVLSGPATAGRELDLRGLDFDLRRRWLFDALRDLRPAEQLRLTSASADDLYWLRYEMEARIGRRYRWSLAEEEGPGPAHTIVHLCPSRAAADRSRACSGTPDGNAVVVSPRSGAR